MNDQELDQLLDAWRAPAASPGLRRQVSAAFPAPERGRILGVPVRWIVGIVLMAAVAAIATENLTNPRLGGEGYGCGDTPSGTICSKAALFIDPPIARLHWFRTMSGASAGRTATGFRGSTWIQDLSSNIYYGVEASVDRTADGHYLVKTSSLSLDRMRRGPFRFTGSIAPLPPNSGPVLVDEGKSTDIDIYRSGNTRIFLRYWFASTPFTQLKPLLRPPMHYEAATLYRNGVALGSNKGTASGQTLWFRLPGQGRYIMALDPKGNSNFTQAGRVNGTALEITVGNDVYRLTSSKPIASGGAQPVYVWHDLAFESELKPGDQEVMFGSAGPACLFNSTCGPKR